MSGVRILQGSLVDRDGVETHGIGAGVLKVPQKDRRPRPPVGSVGTPRLSSLGHRTPKGDPPGSGGGPGPTSSSEPRTRVSDHGTVRSGLCVPVRSPDGPSVRDRMAARQTPHEDDSLGDEGPEMGRGRTRSRCRSYRSGLGCGRGEGLRRPRRGGRTLYVGRTGPGDDKVPSGFGRDTE